MTSASDLQVESDNWFLNFEQNSRILVIGFDQDLTKESDVTEFAIALEKTTRAIGRDFDVIVWCGPGTAARDEFALLSFRAQLTALCRAGARRYGMAVTDKCGVDGPFWAREAADLGHHLTLGTTINEVAEHFGALREHDVSDLASASENCRCGQAKAREIGHDPMFI